jgi:hypothetical protein
MAIAQLIGLGGAAERGTTSSQPLAMTNEHIVAALPPFGPTGPPPSQSSDRDLNRSDWQAAVQRRDGVPPGGGDDAPRAPVDLSAGFASDWPTPAGAVPGTATADLPRDKPVWQKKRRLIAFTRVWAVVKMSISAASTWFTMSAIHAKLGETISGYGVACFWWAIGPHWRKRCFGPGQQLEPELYEVVAKWCWRIGTVLVLTGAAVYLLQLY